MVRWFWRELSSNFAGALSGIGQTIMLFIQNPIAGLIRAFGQLLNASLSFGERVAPHIARGFQVTGGAVQNFFMFWWDFWTNKLPNAAITGLKA